MRDCGFCYQESGHRHHVERSFGIAELKMEFPKFPFYLAICGMLLVMAVFADSNVTYYCPLKEVEYFESVTQKYVHFPLKLYSPRTTQIISVVPVDTEIVLGWYRRGYNVVYADPCSRDSERQSKYIETLIDPSIFPRERNRVSSTSQSRTSPLPRVRYIN
jgi:hypothetical protein